MPGDVVFRVGTSPQSIAVRSVSTHRFSHVGVAVSASPVRIVHATPADEHTSGGVCGSTWAEFALGDDVESVHLYRVRSLDSTDRAQIVGEATSLIGRPFNSEFRLKAPDGSLYCTLLALRCLSRADPSVPDHVAPQRVSLLPDPVYLPESLVRWPRLQPV